MAGELSREIGDLGSSIANLTRAFDAFRENRSKSIKAEAYTERQQKEYDVGASLRDSIEKAVTSPVLTKKLTEALAKGFGGAAAPAIQANLTKAAVYQKVWQEAKQSVSLIDKKIASFNLSYAKLASMPTRSADQNKKMFDIVDKVLGAREEKFDVQQKGVKARRLSRMALGGAQAEALGPESGLSNLVSPATIGSMSKFAKFIPVIGLGLAAASTALTFFTRKINESAEIIGKYSHFSVGGMQAAATMYISDMRRNIDMSRRLSAAMMTFAKTSNKAKDAWQNVNVTMNKFTLLMGSIGNKLLEAGGNILSPVAKFMEKGLDKLLSVLGNGAEEVMARIQRRREFFAGLRGGRGQPGMQPEDIHPIELFMLQLRGFMPGAAQNLRDAMRRNRAVPFRGGAGGAGGAPAGGGMRLGPPPQAPAGPPPRAPAGRPLIPPILQPIRPGGVQGFHQREAIDRFQRFHPAAMAQAKAAARAAARQAVQQPQNAFVGPPNLDVLGRPIMPHDEGRRLARALERRVQDQKKEAERQAGAMAFGLDIVGKKPRLNAMDEKNIEINRMVDQENRRRARQQEEQRKAVIQSDIDRVSREINRREAEAFKLREKFVRGDFKGKNQTDVQNMMDRVKKLEQESDERRELRESFQRKLNEPANKKISFNITIPDMIMQKDINRYG